MVHLATINCVDKAVALIEEGSIDSLRYATLQLRMGIEHLFYELIPLYRDELPEDITTSAWQPRAIIDALLECDPDVDQDARIAILPPSFDNPSDSAGIVKESRAPNKQILKQHYHRLGGYLHAPVDGSSPELMKWHTALRGVVECLRTFKSNQALANIRAYVEIKCDCGRVIKRNRKGVERTGRLQCPNPDCRAIFDAKLDGEKVTYTLHESSYVCPFCDANNFVPTHRLHDGLRLTCVECSRQVLTRSGLILEKIG